MPRAAGLPRRLACVDAPALLQAKQLMVRTTRVPWACAWLMTEVIRELVQPAQPVETEPSTLRFQRPPELVQPTLK